MNINNINHYINHIKFFLTFFVGQAFNIWGQFFTLKYNNISMFESYIRAIPFAWVSWFFMTIAIGLGDTYKVVTPFQDTMILIIMQFVLSIMVNKFWLNKKMSRSDILAFVIIVFGLYISFKTYPICLTFKNTSICI
jgi:hypothetical protein